MLKLLVSEEDRRRQAQAVKVLNAFGVEGLVVIGGDGSFKGRKGAFGFRYSYDWPSGHNR